LILYYAIGGGFGHLARARRVLAKLGLRASILAATSEPRITGDLPTILVPRALERSPAALRQWIESLGAERIIVDAFPCGILGELAGIDVPLDHVARLLRVAPVDVPRFGTTYVVEELHPAHAAILRSCSDRVMSLDLAGEPSPAFRAPSPAAVGEGCVVVHSGPEDEVRQLVDYAREVIGGPITVATRTFPIAPLLAAASHIVSAAGFNIMLETEPFRQKHHIVPMPRRFDDQFTRAARRRAAAGTPALPLRPSVPAVPGSGFD
jgi:predicted glycosyltransferase